MKLFEFEAKKIFAEHGIPVPRGETCDSPESVVGAAERLGYPVAIKSQVLAGGRGKAGGISFAGAPAEAEAEARRLLSMEISGQPVRALLVEEKLSIEREFYLAVTIDPSGGTPIVMGSGEGGVEIEEVARRAPEKLITEKVNIFRGLRPYQARDILKGIGMPDDVMKTAVSLLLELYSLFRVRDAELAEINPLVTTSGGGVVAADAKLIINDNGLFRQGWVEKTRAHYDNDLEYEASRYGLSYVKLDGDIGVLCTGAGLSMATLDLIGREGGRAANFLESGGANYRNAYHGLKLVLEDPDVKVLLINTFGLVSRADVICRGLADALKELKPDKPIVAVLRGTGEEEARRIFREELGINSYPDTESGVVAALELARGTR